MNILGLTITKTAKVKQLQADYADIAAKYGRIMAEYNVLAKSVNDLPSKLKRKIVKNLTA